MALAFYFDIDIHRVRRVGTRALPAIQAGDGVPALVVLHFEPGNGGVLGKRDVRGHCEGGENVRQFVHGVDRGLGF